MWDGEMLQYFFTLEMTSTYLWISRVCAGRLVIVTLVSLRWPEIGHWHWHWQWCTVLDTTATGLSVSIPPLLPTAQPLHTTHCHTSQHSHNSHFKDNSNLSPNPHLIGNHIRALAQSSCSFGYFECRELLMQISLESDVNNVAALEYQNTGQTLGMFSVKNLLGNFHFSLLSLLLMRRLLMRGMLWAVVSLWNGYVESCFELVARHFPPDNPSLGWQDVGDTNCHLVSAGATSFYWVCLVWF